MSPAKSSPEVLVTPEWAEQHLTDPSVRFIEVDVDTSAYAKGHLQGAVSFNWTSQLQDPLRRDILDKAQFEALASAAALEPATTVVLYGDNNNWFAAYAFWLFKLYGHKDVRIIDGGRKKWELDNRKLTQEKPVLMPTKYKVGSTDPSLRAMREEVVEGLEKNQKDRVRVDVRSPQEFSGELIAMAGYEQEGAQRGLDPLPRLARRHELGEGDVRGLAAAEGHQLDEADVPVALIASGLSKYARPRES